MGEQAVDDFGPCLLVGQGHAGAAGSHSWVGEDERRARSTVEPRGEVR